MKIEVKATIPAPPPPRTFVLTLTEDEMKAVMEVANWNGIVSSETHIPNYVASFQDVRRVFTKIWWGVPKEDRDNLLVKK